MYVKVFSGILDSSLMEQDVTTRWAWITLLCLCDADGRVRITREALARRANLPLEAVLVALDKFLGADPDSTTPDLDGRRLVQEAPNQWLVVNYTKYRDMTTDTRRRELTRERVASYRQRKAGDVTQCNAPVTPCNADVTLGNACNAKQKHKAEVEEEVEADPLGTDVPLSPEPGTARIPTDQILALYHRYLPSNPRVAAWTDKRRRALAARWKESKDRQRIEWWDAYFRAVAMSPFLVAGTTEGFRADIDFLLSPSKMVRVTEGFYRAKKKGLREEIAEMIGKEQPGIGLLMGEPTEEEGYGSEN
jgi:hypothetical protein